MEVYQASGRRIAKNTIMLYVRMLVVMAVGLYTSRIVLAALGVRDFGLYNVVGAVVGMLTFLNASLSTAGSRFLTCTLGRSDALLLRKTWSTLINMQILLAVVTVLVMLLLGGWLIETKANIPVERLSSVRFAFYCAVVTTAVGLSTAPFGAAIIAYEHMGAFAWLSFVDVGIKLSAAYSVANATMDRLQLYAALMSLGQIIYAAINVVYCRSQFNLLRYVKTLDWNLIREIYSFAGWHLLTMVSVMLSTQGMVFLNQHYFGAELVAAFAIAVTVETHVTAFINNFRTAANPQVVKSYAAGRYAESKDILINSTLLSLFLYLMLAVPIFIFADQVLGLWLVEVPRWSVNFVRICLVSGLIAVFDVSLYAAIYAKGRLAENATFNIILGLLKFFIAWGLIRLTRWPYTAAVVQCVGYAFIGLLAKPVILYVFVDYGWCDFKRLLVPSFKVSVVVAVMALAIYFCCPHGTYWMLIGGSICTMVIGVSSWYWGIPLHYRQKVIGMVRARITISN